MSYWDWIAGNPLRSWRIGTSASQAEVAARIGVSSSSIQKWEYGASRPAGDNMEKLADLSGIDDLTARWDEWEKEGGINRA